MNKHDVIRFMKRFPNKINPKNRMMSKKWKCSFCGKIYNFQEEVEIPSPCKCCGGIVFESLKGIE